MPPLATATAYTTPILNADSPSLPSLSSKMEASVSSVERILNYSFNNKHFLEEALTHPSYTKSDSYQRLEFIGDAALGLALSMYLFRAYPKISSGQLTILRSVNVSTEKFARVAVRHGLYQFVRHNANSLDDQVREFTDAVSEEDDPVAHGGSVKAPKILADIVESVAAAVYFDVNFDLERLWMIFRVLLEPIVTLEELLQQPQPVKELYERCDKQGKKVDVTLYRNEGKSIASVYVNGELVASCSSEQKDIAKLNSAKEALNKLTISNVGLSDVLDNFNGPFEIEGAKQKLNELCDKKKWPKPTYNIEKEMGPAHEKKYVCSVHIVTVDGMLAKTGEEKMRLKVAENSAAALMIQALQESNCM